MQWSHSTARASCGTGICLQGIELPCASVSKRVYVRNYSYENDFDLHENEPLGGTDLHLTGFALRLVLIQRQKATRK